MRSSAVALFCLAALFTGHAVAETSAPIPDLAVIICAGCKIKPPVVYTIRKAYREAADYEGYPIDSTKRVTLRITEYGERDAAAVALLGPFAGKDFIRGVITINGNDITVEDSARSSFADISSVAENVGIEAQKKIASALKEDR